MMHSLRSITQRLLCLSAGILVSASASAQAVSAEMTPRQIDQFITQLMDSTHVPGLSIAVIRGNKVRYSQGYGLTKADSTQRVTSATVFDAASLSKTVFAYVVLQLVEQKKIDLDKPMFEYLPYPDAAEDERYKKNYGPHGAEPPNGVSKLAQKQKVTPVGYGGYSRRAIWVLG